MLNALKGRAWGIASSGRGETEKKGGCGQDGTKLKLPEPFLDPVEGEQKAAAMELRKGWTGHGSSNPSAGTKKKPDTTD